MSNHTADIPAGYLDGYNFKTFFGVSESQVTSNGSRVKSACRSTG